MAETGFLLLLVVTLIIWGAYGYMGNSRKVAARAMTEESLAEALKESNIRLAADMIGRGSSLEDAALAIYPPYEDLSSADKRAVELELAEHLGRL